ncbi:RING-type domain-containing protein [Pseudozyma hubeiensis]|nr:RING-type domain-containing protein [Pseudozyma hubeiensis]
MADAAPTTRSRRRRTSSSDDTDVQVVIPVSPSAPTSAHRAASKGKRDRKASASGDTITPPPHADEPARKVRFRRSPGKDSTATVKVDEHQSSESGQQTAADVDETLEAAGPSSSSGTNAQEEYGSNALVDGGKVPAVGSSTPSLSSARKASPASAKRPTRDLASELFDDDDDGGESEQRGKRASRRSDADVTAATATRASTDAQECLLEVVIPCRKRRRASSDSSQAESQPSSSSFTTAIEVEPARNNATDTASLQLRIRQLEIQLAESKRQAEQSATVVSAQNTVFQEIHGLCVCHICLEPSFRPCVLAPCGHVFCIHCLRSWFTRRADGEATPPESWSREEVERYERARTLKRKKLCPSCRTELACPPVEVYLIKDMLEKVDHGLELSRNARVDEQVAESSLAILSVGDKARLKGEDLPKGAKLWEDIFDQDGPRRIIFDEVDGVPRCGSCGSEIFDGACSNPSCGIEYDSHSDYEGLHRAGWDQMDGFDSDQDSDEEDRPRPRRNGVLAERLAEFEARHGRSEGLHRRHGNRLELPDDFTGITYIDSSDNEHMVEDGTVRVMRRAARGRGSDDEEDDEEMDDFIVGDDEDLDGYSDSASPHIAPWHRYDGHDFDMNSDSEEEEEEEEEDDFLPGPRRERGGSAIEISDEEDSEGERDSSVEYRGRRGGRRVTDDDSAEDEEDLNSDSEGSDVQSVQSVSDGEEEGRHAGMGSSTDSSVRRRRARIVDEDEEDEDE